MTLTASPNQSRQLPLSTVYTRVFFMGVPSLTLTVTISKVGGAFAAAAGAVADAARADGFGKWVQSGTILTLYAADGTTVVRTFTLNDATTPTSRV